MEREKTFLLAQRSDDQLRRLDEALRRIGDGTYGVCIVCSDLIEKERLEAVPTTQKHVECKNRMKKLNKEPMNF
jgi:RNA polymerase-binding transcription factor DksA